MRTIVGTACRVRPSESLVFGRRVLTVWGEVASSTLRQERPRIGPRSNGVRNRADAIAAQRTLWLPARRRGALGVPGMRNGRSTIVSGGLEHVHQLEPPAEPDGGITSLAGHHPFDAIVLGAENLDHEAHFSPHRCRADAGPSYGTGGGFAPGNP
jgi:hypothetical protein